MVSILVSVGDTVSEEDPLLELESDKATMEVPSPAAGKITEIKVAEGDKVSEGSVIMVLEGAEAGDAEEAPKDAAPAAEAPKSVAATAPPPARATSTPRWWCWAPARAATPRPSAPPTLARRWC